MGHAGYTPEHDDWRIYDAGDLNPKAALNTKPTIARTETMIIHSCILEAGGDTGKNNADFQLQYSDDESSWYDLGAQLATDKMFRWYDDPLKTEHGLISSKLACQTEQGDNHEAACANFDHIAAQHLESSFIIQGFNPSYETTYYFRAFVNATIIPKGSGKSYPQVLIEVAPAGWTGTVDGITNPSAIDGKAVSNVSDVDGV